MKKLSSFFIENYKLTIVISFFVIIFGVKGIRELHSESYPQVDFAMAIVTTIYDGASAEDIEVKITKPIEDEIRSVSGLKDVVSTSQAGMSTIFIRADLDNIDVDVVMSDLQKAVDRVSDLPADLQDAPKYLEINAGEFPVMQIAVVGSNQNRLRDSVADQLKEEMEDSDKVLEVTMEGFRKREFHLLIDHQKLGYYHIGINEILNKVGMRNQNIPGGNLKGGSTQQLLRIEGKIRTKKELQDILIRSNFSGQKIYLKDVATVVDDKAEIDVITHYDGQEATLMIVKKKEGADTIALVEEVMKSVERFRERHKGELKFVLFQDEAVEVQKKLDVLSSNALSGLVLVMLFLFIFLPGRIGLLASMSLPLAVLVAIGLMPILGMTLNAITILALVIALGMLVDNSVVISENFSRLRRDGLTALDAATRSIAKLWLPITATASTTIAAFLPMLVTKGIMGQFIKSIPLVVTCALIISLGESFFLLPMRLVRWGGHVKIKADEKKSDWFSRFEIKFELFMRKMVVHRYWVSVGFLAIIVTSFFFMFVANKFILFPEEDTMIYKVRFEMPIGTKLEKTQEALGTITKNVKRILGDDIKHVIGRAGTSAADMDGKGSQGNNNGLITIQVTDHAKFNVLHSEILKRLRAYQPDFVESIAYESEVHGPPVGDPVNATFRSNNMKSLQGMIDLVMKDLKKIPGVFDVEVDDVIGDDQIFVEIDYQKADRLGFSVQSVGNIIRAAVAGKVISDVTLDNKDVDILLKLKQKYRKDLNSLKSLQVMDARGNLVPLGSFANFRIETGTPRIKRFDFKRAKTVTANLDEEKITSVAANLKLNKIFEKYMDDYSDVSMVFGGMGETTKESVESLFQALILSLIGIFALLVFVFHSFLRPFIIMTTIPLGLFGFSIAFYIHQRPVSFLALIGIIGLGGIIVNSGIILISFIDQMRDEGKLSLDHVLAKASGLRLRAVLVTSLTTICGLLPTAYGVGGRDAMLIPMTLAMAWGLTSGTILTLVWVPCFYAIIEDFNSWFEKVMNVKITETFKRLRLRKNEF